MASTVKVTHNVETVERKRRKSDLVIMWQSMWDVTATILREFWFSLLRLFEMTRLWFASSDKLCLQSWLERHLPFVPTDFAESWRDGRLLGILLDNLQPGCFPDAKDLDPDYALRNVYRAFDVLEVFFGIKPDVFAEEIVTCYDGSGDKLFELLKQLKEITTNKSYVKPVPITEAPLNADIQQQVNFKSPVAKGIGLAVSFIGRMSYFTIFNERIGNLDIMIEIKGPSDKMCCERITSRSPKKKSLTRHENSVTHSPLTRSLSYSENTISKVYSDDSNDNEGTIPLEYEIRENQIRVGYKPLEKGEHKISILSHGRHISGSPYQVIAEDPVAFRRAPNTPLKSAMRSSSNEEHHGKGSVRFSDSTTKHIPDSKTKVIKRRVLRYIIKIGENDVPIETENTESLAAELLKMDYDFSKYRVFRRNSWGFAGEAERRKKSVIRQFCVDVEQLEQETNRKRSRSISVTSLPKNTLTKISSEPDLLFEPKLNMVTEDVALKSASFQNGEDTLVYMNDDFDSTFENSSMEDITSKHGGHENTSTDNPIVSEFERVQLEDSAPTYFPEREEVVTGSEEQNEQNAGQHSISSFSTDNAENLIDDLPCGFPDQLDCSPRRCRNISNCESMVKSNDLRKDDTKYLNITVASQPAKNSQNNDETYYKNISGNIDSYRQQKQNSRKNKIIYSVARCIKTVKCKAPKRTCTNNLNEDSLKAVSDTNDSFLSDLKEISNLKRKKSKSNSKNLSKAKVTKTIGKYSNGTNSFSKDFSVQCQMHENSSECLEKAEIFNIQPTEEYLSEKEVTRNRFSSENNSFSSATASTNNDETFSCMNFIESLKNESVFHKHDDCYKFLSHSDNKATSEAKAEINKPKRYSSQSTDKNMKDIQSDKELFNVHEAKSLKTYTLFPLGQCDFRQFNSPTDDFDFINPVKNRILEWEKTLSSVQENIQSKTISAYQIQTVDVKSKLLFWENAYKTEDKERKESVCEQCLPRKNTSLNPGNNDNEEIGSNKDSDFPVTDDKRGKTVSTNKNDEHFSDLTKPFCIKRSFSDSEIWKLAKHEKSVLIPFHTVRSLNRECVRSSKSITSDYSIDYDDLSENFFQQFTGDEYIDDEISDNAPMYWGDIKALKDMKASICANHSEDLLLLCPKLFKHYEIHKSHPSECKAFGIAMYYGHVAVKNRFQVLTKGASYGNLSVKILGFGHHDVILISVHYVGKDIYEVTYQVMNPGLYLIFVSWGDGPIPGSPFVCKVTF